MALSSHSAADPAHVANAIFDPQVPHSFRRFIDNPDFIQRLLADPCRDRASSVLNCIAAVLRIHGARVWASQLLSIAPLAPAGADARLLHFLGRRIGFAAHALSAEESASVLARGPVLCLRDGYAFLLIALEENATLSYLPGQAASLQIVRRDSALLDEHTQRYDLQPQRPGPGMKVPNRAARFFVLDIDEGSPVYDPEAPIALAKSLCLVPCALYESARLHNFSMAALCEAHRTMFSADGSTESATQNIGKFRTINLRRDSIFVDYRDVPALTEALLERIHRDRFTSLDAALEMGARYMVDFLSIHPFLDGNRRLAMALLECHLQRYGAHLEWSQSVSLLYYAVRCASRGHFAALHAFIRKSIRDTAQRGSST